MQSGGKRYNIPYLYCCCVCLVLLNIEHSVYFGVFIFFGGNQAFPIDYISKMDYFHGDDTTLLRMLKRYNSENVSFVQHFWENALNLLEIDFSIHISMKRYNIQQKIRFIFCCFFLCLKFKIDDREFLWLKMPLNIFIYTHTQTPIFWINTQRFFETKDSNYQRKIQLNSPLKFIIFFIICLKNNPFFIHFISSNLISFILQIYFILLVSVKCFNSFKFLFPLSIQFPPISFFFQFILYLNYSIGEMQSGFWWWQSLKINTKLFCVQK